MGYLWPCSIQYHFGVIRCTCDFSENTISNKYYYFYKSQPKFIKLLNYLLKSPDKTTIRIFEIL